MIVKSYIQKNLKALEKLYNGTTSTAKGLLYSKLAILELCGWIEESMDNIVRMCCHRIIKDKKEHKEIDQIIKRNSGFEYDLHFRNMLTHVIGRTGVIKLEKEIDPKKFQVLKATLSTLKTSRDTEAHTHTKGITKRLDAPSVTRANYKKVYDGLMEIDNTLRKIGF